METSRTIPAYGWNGPGRFLLRGSFDAYDPLTPHRNQDRAVLRETIATHELIVDTGAVGERRLKGGMTASVHPEKKGKLFVTSPAFVYILMMASNAKSRCGIFDSFPAVLIMAIRAHYARMIVSARFFDFMGVHNGSL